MRVRILQFIPANLNEKKIPLISDQFGRSQQKPCALFCTLFSVEGNACLAIFSADQVMVLILYGIDFAI
jgi:hypothetical protein